MERDAASARQIEAADPGNSTWLSANAGSGKTRVLTDRVARLLLAGTDPQNILCLTYTKAAASEMQNRLFGRLGAWAMLPDGRLRQDLHRLGIEPGVSGPQLSLARTLFARAIETPGGLKIQTIHSFCASLLRRFPLEAGVSPQFAEMEDRAAALLRAEVVDELAMGPFAAVVERAARYFTGADFDGFLQEISGKRALFDALPDEAGLRRLFGVAQGLTARIVLEAVLPTGTSALIDRLQRLCAAGSANDVKAARRLADVNRHDAFGWKDLMILEDVLLTKESKNPFSAKIGTFPTAGTRQSALDLMEQIEPLMEAVEHARVDRIRLMAMEQTRALHGFAARFIPAYDGRKLDRGLLDFDDLIRKARLLLTDPMVAQWVLFRLDGGIDHILVDEAQDTSPDQWAVIERLSQEFATGQSARADTRRTLFVVGDKKQSIYSFQGADPDAFDRMRAFFDDRLRQTGDRINPLQLEHSFRSADEILRVVDQTFKGPYGEGLDDDVRHIAFKHAMPGRVDLWPVVVPQPAADETRVWTDPLDQLSPQHHTVILARQIAETIRQMVDTGTLPVEVGDTGTYERRPITEGDFLILLPRRSEMFAEIIRSCKARGLQVAGADRLRVGAELAVRDLVAVLRFLALPEDDLSLAAALKSPLFGWTEQMLFTLAHGRAKGVFLWQVLRAADHPGTLVVLNDLRDRAEFLRPYDLINRILVRHGGRKALLARLGAEAEDGIDALLAQAMAYERQAVPGLTGFLEWMQADTLQVKRQSEAKGSRIRVMTVHGAKGLEAPIVMLPDTVKRQIRIDAAILEVEGHAVWVPPGDTMPDVLAHARERLVMAQIRERRRLLYVAMTRAEHWLIIGAAGDVGKSGESWYGQIAQGMEQAGAVAHAFAGGDGLRLEGRGWDHLPLQSAASPQPGAPFWPDLAPASALKSGPHGSISPSDLGGAKVLADEEVWWGIGQALERGSLVHRLLEHLPQTPPPLRRAMAQALAGPQPTPEAEAAIGDVLAMLDAPHLEAVFAETALVEVELTAVLPALGGRRVHGAIDRLLVGPHAVSAIDFKSNRLVPATPALVPEGILRQMAAYLAVLRLIYPDRRVDVSILWTTSGALMPLPHDMLTAALGRATIP